MEEQQTKRSGVGRLLWLVVAIAIVVLWWFFKPDGNTKVAQALDANASTEADTVLVDLKDNATPDQIAAIERDVGIKLVLVDDTGEATATKLFRAHVDPAREAAIIDALAKRSEVEIAEPDSMVQLDPGEESATTSIEATHEGFPNDPLYIKQWNLRQIGMPAAWKLAQGNGVIVAVLDTGVAYENYGKFHQLPDLAGLTFVDPYDFVDNTKHADDDHGHGSHVTGTIAQATNNGIGVAGIALNVKIMPLKVLSRRAARLGRRHRRCDSLRRRSRREGDQHVLGGAFPSRVLKKAVEYAHDKGVTVVCAAGNEGRGKVGYPAAYPGAIAVSATQYDESITFYSNYGKDIDIAAPGGNTQSADGGRNNPDGGVLQNTIEISRRSDQGWLLRVHGHVDGVPARRGCCSAVVGEGITTPTRSSRSSRTARASRMTSSTRRRSTAPAWSTHLRRSSRRARRPAVGSSGSALLMAGAIAAGARPSRPRHRARMAATSAASCSARRACSSYRTSHRRYRRRRSFTR